MRYGLDELDKLRFSEEEKEEMIRGLLEKRRPGGKRHMRPAYRALVAAVAAVSIFIGAAGAVSLAGLSPQFRSLFGITQEAQAGYLGVRPLNLAFADKNGSGATITVREVVSDQERLYILMEFAAPEGMALPEPEDPEEGVDYYWLDGENAAAMTVMFYEDEGCTQLANPSYGWSYGTYYMRDGDISDGVVTLLYRVTAARGFPENARYCRITLDSLWSVLDGENIPVLENLDMEVVVPVGGSAEICSFDGRCPVWLGGTTMAVAENLSLSSVSISMDLIIPDGAAYDAALEAQGGAWPVYVLLKDGTRIDTRFETAAGRQDRFQDGAGEEFFRSDHIRLTLSCPIDITQIQDIVFEGDNSRCYDGEDHVGETVYFHFWPMYFFHSTYWG